MRKIALLTIAKGNSKRLKNKNKLKYRGKPMFLWNIKKGLSITKNYYFNSDDAEMARRLNQEAAKAVMYGGVSQEDALKMVTLNPAKLLHLDDRMGSIKIGKDADLVLWTDNPLSVYAKVYQTYVDGICLYDSKRDKEMRIEIAKERARLIQKMLDAKGGGEKTQRPKKDKEELYNCGENHEGL